jgi:hypothetical protein
VNSLRGVVEHRQLFEESIAHDAPADHRHGRVGVLGAAARDKEEARRERFRIVGRERVERLAVEREQPARQVTRVAVEEAVRLAGPSVDVAVAPTDDEGVSLEHADRVAVHRHGSSVQRQPLRVRRLPHAAQRDGVRNVTIPLATPARTISHPTAAAAIAGVAC